MLNLVWFLSGPLIIVVQSSYGCCSMVQAFGVNCQGQVVGSLVLLGIVVKCDINNGIGVLIDWFGCWWPSLLQLFACCIDCCKLHTVVKKIIIVAQWGDGFVNIVALSFIGWEIWTGLVWVGHHHQQGSWWWHQYGVGEVLLGISHRMLEMVEYEVSMSWVPNADAVDSCKVNETLWMLIMLVGWAP